MNPVSWLEKITCPDDLKGLRLEALQELAFEIRQMIAKTCSRNGGHFAPSLGVVELTIALHYVLNAPTDKIIWDVGHQAYAHKLLTGRSRLFHTLRMPGGISGFPKRSESRYDSFGAGHASTSISAALGMALGRDQKGESHNVVAVCGDGAMTGGLCYEALNNIGYLGTDMLIILNDNRMSISPNIGAMSAYFNQLLTANVYNKGKETAEDLMKRVPTVGQKVIDLSHRIERSIKDLIIPEDTIFEKLGIRYLGPIDGHNLPKLIGTLEQIQNLKGPILLHVKTVKGKGYRYSESDPEKWHSGVNFEVATGARVAKKDSSPSAAASLPMYTEIFSQTLVDIARNNEKIVAITAAMSTGTGLDRFAKAFPDRFYDVGIAEGHAVCCAAGMAAEGIRPVVAIYSSFLQRAFDQIIHDVALQNLPVVFAIDRAGIVGEDGPTHHGVFDLSFLRMIPNMVIMAPRDEHQLKSMMTTAMAYNKGPIAFRYPRGKITGTAAPEKSSAIEIGRGETLQAFQKAKGPRIAIVSIGTMAAKGMAAADMLQKDGFNVAVADMRFVKPLDVDLLLDLAMDADMVVTLEENVLAGGFGSAVNEALAANSCFRRVTMIGLPDAWIEQGAIGSLLDHHGLSAEKIADRVRMAMEDQSTTIEPSVIAK